MLKSPVQLQLGPGQMYRGGHVQQRRGPCTCLCWLWRQVSRYHFVLSICWWSSRPWSRVSLMEAALWREEFTYMKFGRSYTVTLPRRSVFYRCQANESLFHSVIQDWYEWLSRPNFPLSPPPFPLPCVCPWPKVKSIILHIKSTICFDITMHANFKALILSREERVYHIIHLCRQHDLNLQWIWSSIDSSFLQILPD